jgi:hypothetical protein
MKTLLKFELEKEEFVDKEHIIKDPESGEDLKTTKKVKEAVKKEYFIARPNRGLRDEAELFYNVKHSEAIRRGIMPFALVSKRINDDDGLLSKAQEKEYTEILQNIVNKQNELKKHENKENKEKLNELTAELEELRKKMREIQNLQSSIFDNTAEGYARRKSIFWWLLHLAYYGDKGEIKPFFGEGDFDKKLAEYDKYEIQEDDFINSVIFKFNYYTNIWYISDPKDEKVFKEMIALVEKDMVGDEKATTPEEVVEEVLK